MHLSRFAEELVLWSSPRFGFVRLADRFCTGSSIMPQKKNPDVPELVRGKTGRVYGHLVALLTIMKAQPLAYNKDNQEDKEPVFDIVDTLGPTLAIMADLVAGGIAVDAERMRAAANEGFATATDLADYLVRKGMAFRDAHEVVALAVRHAESERRDLADLPLATLQRFSPMIADDVFVVLALEGSVASRNHPGGTAPEQVRAAIRAARASLASADVLPAKPLVNRSGVTMGTRKLAFLGLGVMGSPMAGHLARAGPRRDGVQPHRGQGGAMGRRNTAGDRRASPAAAATGADIVLMCVGNDDDVRAVTLGRRRRARGHDKGRDPGRSHHGIGERRARSLRRGEGARRAVPRRAGVRWPGRRRERQAHDHGRRRRRAFRGRRAGPGAPTPRLSR